MRWSPARLHKIMPGPDHIISGRWVAQYFLPRSANISTAGADLDGMAEWIAGGQITTHLMPAGNRGGAPAVLSMERVGEAVGTMLPMYGAKQAGGSPAGARAGRFCGKVVVRVAQTDDGLLASGGTQPQRPQQARWVTAAPSRGCLPGAGLPGFRRTSNAFERGPMLALWIHD